ncbi:DUF2637 domain-containing protein [Nocardia colli]|uniref:DUF2637 domain-containing protein n=1 Tax=Nocardia colli TaxID=2545717 RepID=A0A5N0EPU7_9NOCA|nr:DUF2637 domain-containing protein [Nocardia colli]KAA8890830.1 DUF2637 domain-containing protein [Nocardia colli]
MTTITPGLPAESMAQPVMPRRPPIWTRWRSILRPRPLYLSLIVSSVVALKAFEMSFAALHHLAVRNLVEADLASNVPIAIDGLVVGSIVATASFPKRSAGWWYATGLFVLSTLVSVAGNIEYAREIGGGPVSLIIYAGMPLTLLFAVHLTLILLGRSTAAPELPDAVGTETDHYVTAEELPEQTTSPQLNAHPQVNGQAPVNGHEAAKPAAGPFAAGPNTPMRFNTFDAEGRKLVNHR